MAGSTEPWNITIAVVSRKGGVGKTTTAAHLLVAMCKGLLGWPDDLRVLGLDTDPQQSLKSRVSDLRVEIDSAGDIQYDYLPVETLLHRGRQSAAFRQSLVRAAERVDILLIDVPGVDSAELALALRVADIAILPVDTSAMGEGGLEQMFPIIEDVLALNEELVSVLLPTKISPRTKAGRVLLNNIKQVDSALGDLRVVYDAEDPVVLEQRAIYSIAPDCSTEGKSDAEIKAERRALMPGATALEKPSSSGAAGARRDLSRLSGQLLEIISSKLGQEL